LITTQNELSKKLKISDNLKIFYVEENLTIKAI